MTAPGPAPSARREELLEAAYRYVLANGLSRLSLRPLAAAVGSSPRVLLFLFGSKDELVRSVLARARADELTLLNQARTAGGAAGLASAGQVVWSWLAAPEHRALLTLWLEGYARSLTGDAGPWAGFAARTVEDWLDVLAGSGEAAGLADHAGPADGETARTLLLAVLRGALLDLLATGDVERTTAAVQRLLATLAAGD